MLFRGVWTLKLGVVKSLVRINVAAVGVSIIWGDWKEPVALAMLDCCWSTREFNGGKGAGMERNRRNGA